MIHESSDVQSVNIGVKTQIWQYCVILKGAVIGNNCNINCHVFIENDVNIGDNVTIKPGVQIWDGISIASKVFIGPNVTFTNDIFPRSKHYPKSFEKTTIEEGASIGANATILAGNTIGTFSLIGAGTIITKDVPPYSVWYGNPAKCQGYITKEGTSINMQLKDKNGNSYTIANGKPILL